MSNLIILDSNAKLEDIVAFSRAFNWQQILLKIDGKRFISHGNFITGPYDD